MSALLSGDTASSSWQQVQLYTRRPFSVYFRRLNLSIPLHHAVPCLFFGVSLRERYPASPSLFPTVTQHMFLRMVGVKFRVRNPSYSPPPFFSRPPVDFVVGLPQSFLDFFFSRVLLFACSLWKMEHLPQFPVQKTHTYDRS